MSGATAAQLVQAVREEIRLVALLERPGDVVPEPWDREAEEQIVAAMLWGDVTPSCAARLAPPEAYRCELYGAAIAVAVGLEADGDAVSPALVATRLAALGWRSSQPLEAELLAVAESYSVRSLAALRPLGERVVRLWRARTLADTLVRLARQLRAGSLSPAEALACLSST